MKTFEQFLNPGVRAGDKINMLFRLMAKFGYRSHTTGELNLNIIGIRTLDQTPNVFNDWMAVWYYAKVKEAGMEYERPFFHLWQITTDPGTYYLKNPLKLAGTMILKEGQYGAVYSLDLHRGKYLALCQRLGPVKVYRDRNKDEIIDYDADTVESGFFGCNIHRAGKFGPFTWIDKYSAGCQVFRYPHHFDMFITLCEAAKEIWGNKFTYTLINEQDFRMLD
jgi:hypothetical protein